MQKLTSSSKARRAVEALPVWAGAKAAAPARRVAKMAVFMVGCVVGRLFDSIRYGKSDGGELPSLPMNLKNEADGSAEQ